MSRSDEDSSPRPRSHEIRQTPQTKEKYILSPQDLQYFPLEMREALQKEADVIWKNEARLAPGVEARSCRDFLKKLRVFLVKLNPNISILAASMHPLTNGWNFVLTHTIYSFLQSIK